MRKAVLECPRMPNSWYLFRPLDDGDVLWESSGTLYLLRNFSKKKEEDVAPKQKHTPDHVEYCGVVARD